MKIRAKNFLVFFFLIIYAAVLIFSQKYLENYFFSFIAQPILDIPELKIPVKKPKPEIDAKSVVSFRIGGREKVLLSKNPEDVLPIASLTKLMTALIVFEDENYDLEKTWVTISKTAADQEKVPNYGDLDKEVGKKFKVGTLLNLMLVYSSNDAAYALAEEVGIKDFVNKMNQKAREIGMEKTAFFNPTGLRDGDLNLSTANDLLKMVSYILKEKPEIFEMTKEKGVFKASNSIFDIILPEGKELVGGKTGYLPEAGGCMIYIFKDESGTLFLNIILGTNKVEERVNQTQKLVDWTIYGKL